MIQTNFLSTAKFSKENILKVNSLIQNAFCLFLLLLMSSCSKSLELSSIHLVDHNNLSQSIQAPERLAIFQKTNFGTPQPYQKIKRIFKRNKKGQVHSILTSYHSNGQMWQRLGCIDSRANGRFEEWNPDGKLKFEATVIGGTSDLSQEAQMTWIFDGQSRAWADSGSLEASIEYEKGLLQGRTIFYHDSQKIWKELQYEKGLLQGKAKIFFESGALLEESNYLRGEKDGPSIRFWRENRVAAKETFSEGKLIDASYFDQKGALIASVKNGNGKRLIFSKNGIHKKENIENGRVQGLVQVYGTNDQIIKEYKIENGVKEGDDFEFDPLSGKKILRLPWKEGLLQGTVQSFYKNGQMESQKEISSNQRNGLSLSWYEDGSLRFIEHYLKDRLQKGQYFQKGEDKPCSLVIDGEGCCTLFDQLGNFSQKIYYENGIPI